LKNFRAGGGVNYRGRQVIGTKGADTIPDPANPAQAIDNPAVGALDYVYMHPYSTVTLVFNYVYRISRRCEVDFDLKIDNLLNYSQPIYVNSILRPINGDLTSPGRAAVGNRFSWVTPRNYTGTVALKF
jgi:hypothetical protein